jgi:AraC-like DNA-binding protein
LRPSSAAELLAEPIGRCTVGERYCVFACTPELLGFACWGRPGAADVRELLDLCAVGLRDAAPYAWLVDVRGLELIEPATFALFLDYTRRNRQALGRNIVRQAQLRPDGLVGAVISGFSHLARLPYPDRVFDDVGAAIAWLDVDPGVGVPLVAELDAIRTRSHERDSVVARVRAELDASGVLTTAQLARRFAMSTRTLQRALRQAGTTYRLELKDFQVRRAKALLRQGENVARIADDVGFSSAQHFATAYRRATGLTPSAWRDLNCEPSKR